MLTLTLALLACTRTPPADLKPGGRFLARDVHAIGGVPVVLRALDEAGLLERLRARVPDGDLQAPGALPMLSVRARLSLVPHGLA